jgi:hypothetical protein
MLDAPYVIVGGPEGHGPGAERYSCSLCRADAWIGPASIKMLKENPAYQLICLRCYVLDPKVPEAESHQVSSREELIEAFGSEKMADLVAEAGVKFMREIKKKKPPSEPWKRN